MKCERLDIRDKRLAYRVSVGEHQGRESLGKLGIRWNDNIKVDHKIGGVMYINLRMDRSN
jgi:hypothetical protein